MSYSQAIRAFISKIPLGQIFSTREILHLGTRGAIDMCISRMVKSESIVRVARGQFVRIGSELPTTIKVVKKKVRAFGRTIATHAKSLAEYIGLLPPEDTLPIFAISGGNTSFRGMGVRSRLSKVCDRKSKLDATEEGKTTLAFWSLGKDKFLEISDQDFENLLPQDPVDLVALAYAMPAWMSDRFVRLTWHRRRLSGKLDGLN